jgi:hypothetical protein
MRKRSYGARPARAGTPLKLCAALVGLLCASSCAAADTENDADALLLTPAAPAAGPLAYDISLPDSVVAAVVDLKQGFVEGTMNETVALLDGVAAVHVDGLVEASGDLGSASGAIVALLDTMVHIDPSLGIPGVAQAQTLEGAVRDTVFGFEVWHDAADGESRTVVANLEMIVAKCTVMRNVTSANAADLASKFVECREALVRRSLGDVGGRARDVGNMTKSVDLVVGVAEGVADEIEEIGGRALDRRDAEIDPALRAEWERVLDAAARMRDASGRMSSPVVPIRTGAWVAASLAHPLHHVVEAIEELTGPKPDETGARHIFWRRLREDMQVAVHFKTPAFAEGEGTFDEDAKARLERLLRGLVASDRILAQWSIDVTSDAVDRARDKLREHYVSLMECDPAAEMTKNEKRWLDAAMRGNEDLQSALIGVRAAKGSLAAGLKKEELGLCSENEAVSHYKNAWLHSLNAGAMAARALERIGTD